MNKQFLSVSDHDAAAGQSNRMRSSERAASLALPLNSLLDLYDKQQEQFMSATLLPTNVSSIVRRHSSHYYPMLEDKPKQQQVDFMVNMTEQKYGRPACAATCQSKPMPALVRADTPVTPSPPPIPRRMFRGKSALPGNEVGQFAGGMCAQSTPPTSARAALHHAKEITGNVFVYPQPTNVTGATGSAAGSQSALFVDMGARSAYADAYGVSDDDRMSLENSVFDESLTSTPVKVTGYHMGKHAGHARAVVANALSTDIGHVAKRANRSSSSTVDSATLSSGYGSASGHSERFTSTSTTADFRSRFSSEDTQSSLDGSLAEKPMYSPLAKDTFKLERVVAHSDDMHTLNNNELRGFSVASNNNNNHHNHNHNTPHGYHNNSNYSNSRGRAAITTLPAVPARKPATMLPKLPATPSNGSNHSSSDSNKDTNSVSASASSTSAVSVGSSTFSSTTLSSMSMSIAGGNTTNQKRLVPPEPPMRSHNMCETAEDADGDGGARSQVLPPLTVRNKLKYNKPPPIVYPKLQQRQDSTLSSDTYSITSSPGYNSKNAMETPLLQSTMRKCAPGQAQRQTPEPPAMDLPAMRFVIGGNAPLSRGKINFRQDSTISSDSFSQTSSPGYNSKLMEVPLLPTLSAKRLCSAPAPIVCRQGIQLEPLEKLESAQSASPLNKCTPNPASLQTIVRFQNGTPHTMSLQHQIINRRKSSNPYITNGRLRFRLFQILINAFALLAIAGGLAAYFNAYPTIKFVNKTIINTIHVEDSSSFGKNPAPGTCLPIIIKFCQGPQIPYNYTVFPNYIGHFGQLETQVDLEGYEALVDVRCYELVSLFLCTLFVPKCGSTGATVPPCKTLCTETMRRCGFFFDVFGLALPEYLNCKLFKDFPSSEDCVGIAEVQEVMAAAASPKCDGFQCDQNRCLPNEYVCDGHLDCMDQADEANCKRCKPDEIYCGDESCIGTSHICDGIIDCPYGQDERNCLRLSERNGNVGNGVLEVFRINKRQWMPACVKNWDRAVSPSAVCSILGYSSVNATSVVTQRTHRPLLASVNVSTSIWKMYAKKRSTLMQEFSNCKPSEDYPIAELTCSNYECGKVKRGRHKPSRRIIGGSLANPGNWPFLAAILGGPEKIFYCAGVLISDQWVLTASHCVGNHTVIDLEDWTIQLGVTRRNSFTYTGQKVKVKTVIPHPLYNIAIAHDNDIALFQLATRVAFHEHLLPVCLPPPNIKYLRSDLMCTVIGWGKREDKDPKSTYEFIVNEVQVPIIRRAQCDEWLDNLTVSEGMVCAGYDNGGKDACQGDSGGPLLCPYPGEKDRWFVGGIVSWGIMCAHPKLPGVYANVIKYVPWIQEQMQKYTRPISEDRVLKYDAHPGGPDILSKMATGPIRNRKPYHYSNGKPMGIDYYDSETTKTRL